MARAEQLKILYNGNIIVNNSPKNAVAYYIIKHMVENQNYKYDEIVKLFNNVKDLTVKTKEIVKKKENISVYKNQSEKDNNGEVKSRKASYLPNKSTDFIECKDNQGNSVEFGVWTEWEYKNFPIFTDYITGLNLGYEIIQPKKDNDEDNTIDVLLESHENIDIVEWINLNIREKGYIYDKNCISNLYISLKTKPFVILSGISGTGKSKLVKLFAEALGSTSDNNDRFTLIPVRPDWSDSSDLIGYRDLNGKFHPGLLTTVIEKAIQHKEHPYFVCLDEMNLARVEYYLSDILSIIESRYINQDGEIKTDKLIRKELLGKDQDAISKYGDLYIPENLYIIGTVNMDETTFPFSKKVLDRANTIEFNEVNLEFDFDEFESEEIEAKEFTNSFLKSKYIKLIDCKEDKEQATDIINELIKINNILEKYNQHFAYRVRDEIVYYCLYALKDDLFTKEQALDYCIVQKILPKVCGSDDDTAELLKDLYNYLNKTKYTVSDFENNKVEENNTYKLSSKKIVAMIRRFVRDGFTNFWQ